MTLDAGFRQIIHDVLGRPQNEDASFSDGLVFPFGK